MKIFKKGKSHPNKEVNSMITRIEKIAFKGDDLPNDETLGAYVDAIQLYYKDHPDVNNVIADQIQKLPSARKIRLDYSEEECKILFESVAYIWREITGQDIIEESKITKGEDAFTGNYWLLENGVILEGINHYSIIKQNATMFSTLLNVNGFALQHYLSSSPEKVIYFIIKNGGIRMLIRKDNKGYFQLSERTYAQWGKSKIKTFDLREKIVKILDSKAPYQGWNSGIPIKL